MGAAVEAGGTCRRSGRHVGAAAEAGGTWAPPQESQKRSVQGRRH